MTYTVNLPTTGPAHPFATVDLAKAYARARGALRLSDVDQFIVTVWDRCKAMNVRPEVVFGQWCDETNVGKSDYWRINLNPGGLRITYDGEHSNTWADGNTAALGMLHRLSLYIYGYEHAAIPDGKQYDPSPEKVGEAGYLGIAKKLNDLSGRWAANMQYGAQIAGHLNQAFPRGEDAVFTVPVEQPPAGGPSMNGIPIVKNILPWSASNRPGSKLPGGGQLYIVVHETGNAGAGADADNQIAYLQTAEARSRSVSYHLSVDDHQIVQGLPLDEIGYHAGDGCDEPAKDIGCFRSIAIEACINQDGDEMQMRRNLAECIARICAGDPGFDWGGGATKGRFDIDHILQHYQVNADSGADRHYCPQHILQQGFWPTLMLWVDQAWLKWGTTPTPVPDGPKYAKPGPIPVKRDGNDHAVGKGTFYACERVVRADGGAHFLNVADPKGKDTRAVARANEAFRVAWAVKGTGAVWYWVTPHGSRIAMHDTDTELAVKRAA